MPTFEGSPPSRAENGLALIYHVTTLAEWANQTPPPSLESEGFVHCCRFDQLDYVKRVHFAHRTDLVVLAIEESRLGSELVYEDCYQTGQRFPHVYGPIVREAVVAILPFSTEVAAFESPLLEKPPSGLALIEPARRFPQPKLPSRGLITFFPEVVEQMGERGELQELGRLGSAIGPRFFQRGETAVISPGVGAPLAAVAVEESVALGCRQLMVIGGAGSLYREQTLGHLILIEAALRDEGTSHHYLDPSLTVEATPRALSAWERVLSRHQLPFRSGRSWTTDALYRETPDRIERRRGQGCLVVEMEAAALLAVAHFRRVELAQLVYCGDDLSGLEWDFRGWTAQTTLQEKLIWLGLEACDELRC